MQSLHCNAECDLVRELWTKCCFICCLPACPAPTSSYPPPPLPAPPPPLPTHPHPSLPRPQVVGEYSYVLEEDQEEILERLAGLMGCRHDHQETSGWVVAALSKIIARLGRFPDSVLNHITTYLVNPNTDIQQVCVWGGGQVPVCRSLYPLSL